MLFVFCKIGIFVVSMKNRCVSYERRLEGRMSKISWNDMNEEEEREKWGEQLFRWRYGAAAGGGQWKSAASQPAKHTAGREGGHLSNVVTLHSFLSHNFCHSSPTSLPSVATGLVFDLTFSSFLAPHRGKSGRDRGNG
jgi:hypothetical protein